MRIGTRGSRLALAQAGGVRRRLAAAFPSLRFALRIIRTRGDEFQATELFRRAGAVGVFTKTIERELLAGRIDLAVHSLKDLPTEPAKGLVIAAIPRRLDPSDALVSRDGRTLSALPEGAAVGTGSPRRARQLLLARPDLDVRPMRGNLDTRIGKVLKSRELDAVLVARAGLLRLGRRYLSRARRVDPEKLLPAPGQAALALQSRASDTALRRMLRRLHHPATEAAVNAERSFLHALRGGCRVPVGALATVRNGRLVLRGAVFSMRSPGYLSGTVTGTRSRAQAIGRALAARLLSRGAARFLKEARA